MIVSFNFYYAHPDRAEAVLKQRLRASEVRQRIKLPYGRVMRRILGDGELPDVIWEHEFAEVGGHHADMAARAASPEFEAIRAGMRPLIRRFERPLFEVSGAAASTARTPASGPPRVISLEWIFCAPEKTAEVLTIIDRYAGLYAKQGLNHGRVLRLVTPAAHLPEVIWQHDYNDTASREVMQAELARSTALQSWRADAGALAADVQTSVWQVE